MAKHCMAEMPDLNDTGEHTLYPKLVQVGQAAVDEVANRQWCTHLLHEEGATFNESSCGLVSVIKFSTPLDVFLLLGRVLRPRVECANRKTLKSF